jgi:trimeric autotransporter adhesin
MHKIITKNILIVFFLCVSFATYSQIINTVAGNGGGGYSGDGGQATSAELYTPTASAIDNSGNIYIADESNNRVRKVNTSGIISTVAGRTASGYSGDGAAATAAQLNAPIGVAVDTLGNIYIADELNDRIRIVSTSGIINTFAGNGYNSGSGGGGYSGDGGPATVAELHTPTSVTLDNSGNVYIADLANQRIRIVNTSGIITTVAGNGSIGYSGDGGLATDAELQYPYGVATDATGNLYIADEDNNCIRMVNTSGDISTIAGNTSSGFSGNGGQATVAELYYPTDIAVDASGNLYIADSYNNRIRSVNTSGIIRTFAGTSGAGFSGDGGPATAADLFDPTGVATDLSGNVYITDYDNNRIRKVTGIITGINSLPVISDEVTIYPVPTTGSFIISGISPGQTIELYNYLGQKVLSATNHQPLANFDISNQANGIYLIRLINKDGSIVTEKKIVKIE